MEFFYIGVGEILQSKYKMILNFVQVQKNGTKKFVKDLFHFFQMCVHIFKPLIP